MAKFFIEDDLGNVRIVPLDTDEVTVGRAEDNDIVLPDRNVSRHHARVRRRDDRFVVTPVAARYGLRVNGVVVDTEVEVGFGEAFRLGDYTLKLLPPDVDVETPVAEREVRPSSPAAARMTRQDVEEAARVGWRSDFYDEDDRRARRAAIVRLVVLFFLAIIAVGLGVLYYRYYVDQDAQWERIEYRTPGTAPASPASGTTPD